jgi:hypothetical protein
MNGGRGAEFEKCFVVRERDKKSNLIARKERTAALWHNVGIISFLPPQLLALHLLLSLARGMCGEKFIVLW